MISIEEKRKIWLRRFEEEHELFRERIERDIEKHRKGDARILVTDEKGAPVSNKRVKITQKTHDFGFGAHIFLLDGLETPERNAEYRELFAKYFNLATVPFYWSDLEPEEGKPRFEKDSPKIYRRPAPDLCVEYCEERGIRPKLHCLVYDKFTPDWLPKGDMSGMEAAYEKHIAEIAERYRGRLCEFEVINESLYSHEWTTASVICDRADMVEWAFGLSRRHLPGETLVINEGQSQIPDLAERRHFARYFMQIERAIAKGAQIDKIGLQHHIFTGCTARTPDEYDIALQNPTYVDPRQTLSALDTLARIGLPLEITEMTVPAFGDTPEDEELQADLLEYIYTVLFSHPALDSIVYWNSVEGYCYDAGPHANWNENRCRGALFRRDLSPKPSAERLYELINETWHTELEATTDAEGYVTVRGFFGDYELEYEGGSIRFGIHKDK